MKEVILEAIKRLNEIEYVDTAEHLYNALKVIKRHLDDDNLDYYIDYFLWGLESPTVLDISGSEIKNLCDWIRENRIAYKRETKLDNLGI
jgi:hypothetical protein